MSSATEKDAERQTGTNKHKYNDNSM